MNILEIITHVSPQSHRITRNILNCLNLNWHESIKLNISREASDLRVNDAASEENKHLVFHGSLLHRTVQPLPEDYMNPFLQVVANSVQTNRSTWHGAIRKVWSLERECYSWRTDLFRNGPPHIWIFKVCFKVVVNLLIYLGSVGATINTCPLV